MEGHAKDLRAEVDDPELISAIKTDWRAASLDEPTRAMLMAEVRRQNPVAAASAEASTEPAPATFGWLRWALGGMTATIVALGITSLSNFNQPTGPDTMAHADIDSTEAENEIKGGVVPSEYIPAVEKGVKEAMDNGVIAGYPVVDVKVTLYVGSYHDVDSSEMAFKIAGSIGFRDGVKEASPVLLEPIMKVEVVTPEDYMGDVVGDLNRRRGIVGGMEDSTTGKIIRSEVPLAEMFGYATDLRSATQGRATYSMEFDKYKEVPNNLSDAIVKKNS